MKPLLAVCLHDGFYGCGTGAGVANRAFLDALNRLLSPGTVDLVVLPVEISTASVEYNADWHALSMQLVDHAGGQVIPLDNGTSGSTRWGGIGAFRVLADATAEALMSLPIGPGRRLLVGHDVPFFGLSRTLPRELTADLVLVAHSTAGIHSPDDRERVAWEKHSLGRAARQGARVAAISAHMRRHLTRDYELPDTSVIDLPIGLTPADWQRRPPADHTVPRAARDGFWLAMGRAVRYKGFDDLLDALGILRNAGDEPEHLVLAAVTDGGRLNDYQAHLAKRIALERPNVTLRTRFSDDIQNLLAHPALRAVVVPSRAEPFGRIPLEAYAAGATPVVATAVGGIAEQVVDGRTGFTAPPGNPTALAQALRDALQQPAHERAAMRTAAAAFATRYDTATSVAAMLASEGVTGTRRRNWRRVQPFSRSASRWELPS